VAAQEDSMREIAVVVRGMATLALTGLGVMVVLRGDGAATHAVLGALLITGGICAATIGRLLEIVDGGFPVRRPTERH
jgi:hypothetical protein